MRVLPARSRRKMILLDQSNREFPVRGLPAQSQIASGPSAIDPPAKDQYIERLRPQPLNRRVSRVRIDGGGHLYILECLKPQYRRPIPTNPLHYCRGSVGTAEDNSDKEPRL